MTDTANIANIIKETVKASTVTRLIAQENINVTYSEDAKTASFTPATRTITYPYSMMLEDQDIHMIFIFHEVGHAIFSENIELFDLGVKNGIATEFNITEDIRIERLIKNKYPGVIKNFVNGYKKLLEKNFFGPVDRINMLSFSNRLNIYAKLGPIAGKFIEFTKEEIDFYNRCISAKTEKEAYDLAVELSEINKQYFSKENINNIFESIKDMIDNFEQDSSDEQESDIVGDHVTDNNSSQESNSDQQESDDSQEFQEDFADNDFHGTNNQKYSEKQIEDLLDEILEFKSNEHFQNEFEKTTISNCSVISYSPADKSIVGIYTHKDYYDFLVNQHGYSFNSNPAIKEYINSIKTSVDSMAKEFESKKAAFRFVNRRVSDSGLLDVNRLVNYKFSDQIFSQRTKIADAKNHGFVIMLDCSGSVSPIFNELSKQVVVLTEFFRKIKVKYKVYGYGAWVKDAKMTHFKKPKNTNSLACKNAYDSSSEDYLVEFLSSEQNNQQHFINICGMLNTTGVYMCQTPTIDTLSQLEFVANEFFTSNNIQIKKIINITDGEPSDICSEFYYYNKNEKNGKNLIVIDPITKKTYMGQPYPYFAVDVMGGIFRDRYDISIVSIAIRDSGYTKYTFTGKRETNQEEQMLKKESFYKTSSEHSNDLFVVKSVKVNTDISSVSIKDTDSVSVAFGKFKRALVSNNKSKNFLNILSQYLSIC